MIWLKNYLKLYPQVKKILTFKLVLITIKILNLAYYIYEIYQGFYKRTKFKFFIFKRKSYLTLNILDF